MVKAGAVLSTSSRSCLTCVHNHHRIAEEGPSPSPPPLWGGAWPYNSNKTEERKDGVGACSHLEITKCGDGESCGQESRMDICMYTDAVTQGHTPPPYSDGSCKPINEYPTALRGPCSWGNKAGVPAANGTTSLFAYCWLTPPPPPPEWGPRSQFWLQYVNTYKYVQVCVCVLPISHEEAVLINILYSYHIHIYVYVMCISCK